MHNPALAGIEINQNEPDAIPLFDVFFVDYGAYQLQVHRALEEYDPGRDDFKSYLENTTAIDGRVEKVFESAPVTTIGDELRYTEVDLLSLSTRHQLFSYIPILIDVDIVSHLFESFSKITVHPLDAYNNRTNQIEDITSPLETIKTGEFPQRFAENSRLLNYLAEGYRPLTKELILSTDGVSPSNYPETIHTKSNSQQQLAFTATVKRPTVLTNRSAPGILLGIDHTRHEDEQLDPTYHECRRQFNHALLHHSAEVWETSVTQPNDEEANESVRSQTRAKILEKAMEIHQRTLAPFSAGGYGKFIQDRFDADKFDYYAELCPSNQTSPTVSETS